MTRKACCAQRLAKAEWQIVNNPNEKGRVKGEHREIAKQNQGYKLESDFRRS